MLEIEGFKLSLKSISSPVLGGQRYIIYCHRESNLNIRGTYGYHFTVLKKEDHEHVVRLLEAFNTNYPPKENYDEYPKFEIYSR